MKIERCCACDEPTGKAGAGDGSLYTEGGRGPFCGPCFDIAKCTDDIFEMLQRMQRNMDVLCERVTRLEEKTIGLDTRRMKC